MLQTNCVCHAHIYGVPSYRKMCILYHSLVFPKAKNIVKIFTCLWRCASVTVQVTDASA